MIFVYPVCTSGSLSHITTLSTIVDVQRNLVTTDAEFETHRGLLLLCCFVLSVTSPPGGARHLFFTLFIYFHFILFILFLGLFRFSLGQRIWIASIYTSYLSYPVRWHVIASSTPLTALQCSISVLSFCDYRACISLGGRIGTDTGCAGCRRVEITV